MSGLSEEQLERLSAYLDGELDEDSAAAFEKECEENEELAAELEEWRETVSVLSEVQPEPPESGEFERAVARRIRRRSRGRFFSHARDERRPALFIVTLAALGVLVIIALLLSPGRLDLLIDGVGTPEDDETIEEPADGAPDAERGTRGNGGEPGDARTTGQPPAPPIRASGDRAPQPEVMPLRRIEFRYTIHAELDEEALGRRLRQQFGRENVTETDGGWTLELPRAQIVQAVESISTLGRVERERVETEGWSERAPIRVLASP